MDNILIVERRGREVSHAFIENISNIKDEDVRKAVEHAIDTRSKRNVFKKFGGSDDLINAAYEEIITNKGFYFNSQFFNNPPFEVEHIVYHYSD